MIRVRVQLDHKRLRSRRDVPPIVQTLTESATRTRMLAVRSLRGVIMVTELAIFQIDRIAQCTCNKFVALENLAPGKMQKKKCVRF